MLVLIMPITCCDKDNAVDDCQCYSYSALLLCMLACQYQTRAKYTQESISTHAHAHFDQVVESSILVLIPL